MGFARPVRNTRNKSIGFRDFYSHCQTTVAEILGGSSRFFRDEPTLSGDAGHDLMKRSPSQA